MTENRHFAGWARSLAALVALAGLIGLTGCGGGSGSPNNVFSNPGVLSITPNPLTAYSGTPATVTIQGGHGPFTIVSSDQSALPTPIFSSGNTLTLLPNSVTAATPVTLTIRDSFGDTAQTVVTVNPAPFLNSLKLKADAYTSSCPDSGGSANPIDDSSVTFICAGQTGSVAVRLASVVGGNLAGRLVRFDIVQGAFQLFTELPGQTPTFALTYTVPTDANGTAVARIRAVPGASQQVAVVQATDVSTGSFVRGTFVIVSTNNASASDLVVIPDDVTITGPDDQTCSSGVAATYFIFGGQPPYTVVSGFPGAVLITPTVVTTMGAGFTVVTTGACLDPITFAITDAVGHTVTVTLHNVKGENPPPTQTSPNPIVVTPAQVPLLACGASTNVAATGGGTVATTGNQQTTTPATSFFVGVSRPDLLSAAPPDPAAGAPITLTRLTGTPIQGSGANVNVSLLISDGGQTRTINVPVTGAACP